MKPQIYLVVIIAIAILSAIVGQLQDSDRIASLGTNSEEVQCLAAHEADIRRQRSVIADTFLHEVQLRWENSLTPRAAAMAQNVLCDAHDADGRTRMHLIFQGDSGRINTISLLEREGSDEGRLSPENAERVAGAWLNRLHNLMPGPWRPLGRESGDSQRDTIFSRWQGPGCVAFIGIERGTGMPRLINFRYSNATTPAGRSIAPTVAISSRPPAF